MKRGMLSFLVVLSLALPLGAETGAPPEEAAANPFLSEFSTPFGVPPFDLIRTEHYLPAMREGIAAQQREVEAITGNPEPPTFANTVEALERSGALLTRVRLVFNALSEVDATDEMQRIANESAPMVASHIDDIRLNEKLFARFEAVWDQRDALGLTLEQAKLLERHFKDFVRGGANLVGEQREELRRVNQELSVLQLKFGDNLLAETKGFTLVLDKREDLAGLPQGVVDAAAEAAKARGLEGKWVFGLDKPSLIPFLERSTRRDLRQRLFEAYVNRGNHDDEHDNKAILSRIAALRVKKANLLGFPTYAHFALDDSMAKTPDRVRDLLGRLWTPALEVARKEADEMRALIAADGQDFDLQPWDWFFYANRVLSEKYAVDPEALRPYFQLDNVVQGVFGVCTRLWGIRFVERPELPKYHPEVKVYEVQEADGSHLGILYVDYFPRDSKRGGAWMNELRQQSTVDGKRVAPVVTNNGNFTRPSAGRPSLLTLEETLTLFHEFGHGLHALLAKSTFERVSGTNVAIDFVELPSQIMENWALHPEVLASYARHYKTGETIPAELVERVTTAAKAGQGFATVEYLAASLLDLDWHALTEARGPSVPPFEAHSRDAMGLVPEIEFRYRSTYFNHVFGGNQYAAGYYSYIWAEVLDKDAFAAFEEKGIFDPATAESFRRNILERGGSEDPMTLYVRFRGREPEVESLLKKRGLL